MFLRTIALMPIFLFLFVQKAFALQVHPPPEGLYAHQIAHLFYFASMIIFIYWIRRSKLGSQKAWRYIQYGCALLALWNILAFVGHIIEHNLPEELFVGEGWGRRVRVENLAAGYLYLLLKMDHLICVPAVIMLFMALRWLRKRVEGRA